MIRFRVYIKIDVDDDDDDDPYISIELCQKWTTVMELCHDLTKFKQCYPPLIWVKVKKKKHSKHEKNINNTANTKWAKDRQTWRRLKQIVNLLAQQFFTVHFCFSDFWNNAWVWEKWLVLFGMKLWFCLSQVINSSRHCEAFNFLI